MPKKIVLAYSGGLDTSVIMRWLKETYACEVIAFCADVGQGEDLEAVKKKALATGASKCHVYDLREEFVRDFVFPMLRADAAYEQDYLMGTSIARPVIAKAQMDVVKKEGADAVSHGSTGKGNDQVRFELGYYHFDPHIEIIAPWRIWDLKSRSDLIRYTKEHSIPVEATAEKPYSIDRNLFHTSYEGGILEDPWKEPDAGIFQVTKSPEDAPNTPRYVEIEIEGGTPVAIDGEKLAPAALLTKANAIAGEHGVGRVDLVEDRYVGMKARGVYETPGGTILRRARRAVETVTLDREVIQLRDSLMPRYAQLVYNGFWFAPERVLLQKLVDEASQPVSGTARLKLYKGNCIVAGRKSPRSLYRPDFATFEAEQVYDQKDAGGFIKLNALRLRISQMRAASK
ncbi:MAG TPA: argininosuccinate synthase [Polyangia bacterium]|jgi:argininosuccinate synthase